MLTPHMHEKMFRSFLAGEEFRANDTFVVGTESLVYSQGVAGGMIVPQKFITDVSEGMALVDPLLDEAVSTVFSEPDYSLRPLNIPGWDLSSISATKVGETSQESAATTPTLDGRLLAKHGYRAALDCSLEFEQDAQGYGSAEKALGRALGVALARGEGKDLVNGDGSSAPQGI